MIDYGAKLEQEMAKHLRTTFIGILNLAEGFYDGPENPTTKEEYEQCEKFEIFRKELLDYGNKILRRLPGDLDKYDIRGRQYKYDFKLKN